MPHRVTHPDTRDVPLLGYSRRCTTVLQSSPSLGTPSCTPLCFTCVSVPDRWSLEVAADSRHRAMLLRGVLGGCKPSISSKAAPATLRGAPRVAHVAIAALSSIPHHHHNKNNTTTAKLYCKELLRLLPLSLDFHISY